MMSTRLSTLASCDTPSPPIIPVSSHAWRALLADDPATLTPLALFTVIVLGSLFLFREKSVQFQEHARETASYTLDVVLGVIDWYRLIADYFMRPFMQGHLTKRVAALRRREACP